MIEKHPASNKKTNYDQNHYDEEKEVFQIFCVVRLVRDVSDYLAEATFKTFSANTLRLAFNGHANSTVHALPRTVGNFTSKNLNI